MEKASMIGMDLAKNSFQLHGAGADGSVAFRKKLSRSKVLTFLANQAPCVVAMEACAGAHDWSRRIQKLGHEVRLAPPAYVKPFVKRQKNDTADAEAIAEAASRPTMRFVAVKTVEQQSRAQLFRARDLLVRQRTQTINALGGHLAEFRLIAPQGRVHVETLEVLVRDESIALPDLVRRTSEMLFEQIEDLDCRISTLDHKIRREAEADQAVSELTTIPGVGPITAMAVLAFAPDMENFRCGRDFAAWCGLVPRQHSTGGKARFGKISKMAQRDLRRLFIIGAMAVIQAELRRGTQTTDKWLTRMLQRKPRIQVAIAPANKTARVTWALRVRGETYRAVQCAA